MSHEVYCSDTAAVAGYFVPGTCFTVRRRDGRSDQPAAQTTARDPALRDYYLPRALADVPRVLGAIDRNPYSPTYGCLDRQYWHYRTSSFPSEMYQEGVLPLALVYSRELPGNRWFGNRRVRELAVAGIRFAARSSHADGSCDDYYPFERALGAAVFSLQAATRAYQLLELNDPELLDWFGRRAAWLINHDESGHLANHQALAALGLLRVGQITGKEQYRDAAKERIAKVLGWQSDEGWFEEYGGADPGYQTVTIDALAKYRQLTGDASLDEPLRRAVAFARFFLHPDDSYAGEYGSRGTYHFYPRGMELLAAENAAAAELADGFLRSVAAGTEAHFSDDRMFAHRLGNMIEAHLDWSPSAAASELPDGAPSTSYFPRAQLLVRRTATTHTVISAARGGVFKHFAAGGAAVTDAGLIVETADGRVAVSQWHDSSRRVELSGPAIWVSGPLVWSRFETATPLKQSLLHTGMWSIGRYCRSLVRRTLQRRLITSATQCPVRLSRSFELLGEGEGGSAPALRVTDTIELTSPRVRVRRMGFGTDHQAAYVAASGVYQQGVLAPWIDLADHVAELNSRRRVVVVREL